MTHQTKDPDAYTFDELDVLVASSPQSIRQYWRSPEYYDDLQRHISNVKHVERDPNDFDASLAAGYTNRAKKVLFLVLLGQYPRSSWAQWIYDMPQYDVSIKPSRATCQRLVQGVSAILRRFPES